MSEKKKSRLDIYFNDSQKQVHSIKVLGPGPPLVTITLEIPFSRSSRCETDLETFGTLISPMRSSIELEEIVKSKFKTNVKKPYFSRPGEWLKIAERTSSA
jgi:hypothetical protein